MSATPESPTSSTATPEDTPTVSPSPEVINKFNFLRHAKNARKNPFVKARPFLNRESSTTELFSRENSSSDFFQNSRLNLFDTAPKPEATEGFGKVNSYSTSVFIFSYILFNVQEYFFLFYYSSYL